MMAGPSDEPPAAAHRIPALTRVFAIARADFLERTRRYSFLITLIAMIWGAYVFLPPNHATYATLEMGNHRGLYNSAWIGALVAMLSVVFLSLAGFYLIKNTVERDRLTGVGQILAATPLGRTHYVFGKALSNFAVLSAMVAVLAVAALAMQQILGESRAVDPLALVTPFVLITLPTLALISAIAVLFEVWPALRGGFGNIAYFFLWMGIVTTTAIGFGSKSAFPDPLGKTALVNQMQSACAAAFPDYVPERDQMSMGFQILGHGQRWNLTTFEWKGARWTRADVAGRMMWLLVAMGMVLIAASRFDRFDEAPAGMRASGRRAARKRPVTIETGNGDAVEPRQAAVARPSFLSGVARATRATAFLPLVGAEFALLTRGHSRWWYLITGVLMVLSLCLPLAAVRMPILPLLWIWPVLIWSGMGSREARHGTDGLLFSSARPLRRQLPAAYFAGVALAATVGAGVALRFVLARDGAGLGAWGAGALFIPAFALASGVWSGGRKLFEILYLLLWYVGPMNQAPMLDFMGATTGAVALGVPRIEFAVTIALLALAALGRVRQLRT